MSPVGNSNPPRNSHGVIWLDADGNVDWDAYADDQQEA
ncbi:Uncharacterised protein [Mycobacteroides abscessus subsp. abscessus]|nr:Uncharacterised protein [Mycobacteroides abscessus subsp. abscessus]SID58072.1 Uncharacterised protein [Mycobacteroides abscessus subsp. abscessus]SKO43542.1 Uncharacterised protein [Mycobacteroides abscessus subsp. abscessus]SLJ20512.1 Uncharacterised protein [Mycobacteroides abscessus subsp. abscessus]SLJ24084.1 Uncharacterised protein [Mycobacteroides abscessus subsp. abscessus]